ncbi:hypothetical protein VE01_04235 [Pseudogymnoascus verrucosus]|uniref:Regulator of chromosome condensation n=1 Tax=Pseudogymnoascus verrucosus TaxID=342668 RepID=A0A1B8GLT5_9PEZI|nr:uncharacterized protein VE01_04235 [Pseudogymnoascus verrucosus]OBT96794.2 hypothetical protein VE01_04235 [Pseudogymnoascus verrucosus]
MMEVWARGNNVWRQLEFSPSSDEAELPKAGDEEGRNEGGEEKEEEEIEPRDLDMYGKVFEAERVEWVRSDGFGCIVKYNTSSYAIAGSPTPFLRLSLEEGDVGQQQNALAERHAQALQRNGMGNGWAVSGTGMVVDITGIRTQLPLSLSLAPNTLTFPSPLSLSKDTTQITAGTTHFAALTASGTLYTWGDPRHPSPLGRHCSSSPDDDGSVPADEPGFVTALEGIPGGGVVKVVAAGYVTAALTGEGGCYVMGGGTGEVECVEFDVVDVAVWDGGVGVLDKEGGWWVRGETVKEEEAGKEEEESEGEEREGGF